MTARPLISDISSHVWLTGFPSLRPFWTGGPGDSKFTIQNSLPSAFRNIKPGHVCTSSHAPLHNTAVPSYPQPHGDRDADVTEDILVSSEGEQEVLSSEQTSDLGNLASINVAIAPAEDHKQSSSSSAMDSIDLIKNNGQAQVSKVKDTIVPTRDIELSSISKESSTDSVISVHVYETAQAVEASGELEIVEPPFVSAPPVTATPQHRQGHTRHFMTRIQSAGRRVISFMRRIKRGKEPVLKARR